MPALRILLDADGNIATTNDRGGLVFERGYNEGTDQHMGRRVDRRRHVRVELRPRHSGDINNTTYGFDATLAQWRAFVPNAVIIGFSSSIGSG